MFASRRLLLFFILVLCFGLANGQERDFVDMAKIGELTRFFEEESLKCTNKSAVLRIDSLLGQAIDSCQVAVRKDSLELECRRELAELYIVYRQDYLSALHLLDYCLERDSIDARSLSLRAQVYFEFMPTMATVDLGSAITYQPSNLLYWADLASAYVLNDDVVKADSVLFYLNSKGANSAKYYKAKALRAACDDNFEAVIAACDTILSKQPLDVFAFDLKAKNLLFAGKWNEALAFSAWGVDELQMPLYAYTCLARLLLVTGKESVEQHNDRFLLRDSIRNSVITALDSMQSTTRYTLLLDKFKLNYSEMRLEEYLELYLLQSTRSDFSAIDVSQSKAKVLADALLEADYAACLSVGAEELENNPCQFLLYGPMEQAARAMGNAELALEYAYKSVAFSFAVLASGRGDTSDDPIRITAYGHRDDLLEWLDLSMSGSEMEQINGHVYEKTFVFDRNGNRQIFYFLTDPIVQAYLKMIDTKE